MLSLSIVGGGVVGDILSLVKIEHFEFFPEILEKIGVDIAVTIGRLLFRETGVEIAQKILIRVQRAKRRCGLFFNEFRPVKIIEPRMTHNLQRTGLSPDPFLRIFNQQFRDQIFGVI